MKRTLTAATVALLGFGVTATMAQPKAPRVVPYKFFDEQYRPGGFDYAYGGKSKGITITKDGGYKSKAALNIKLDPSEYFACTTKPSTSTSSCSTPSSNS